MCLWLQHLVDPTMLPYLLIYLRQRLPDRLAAARVAGSVLKLPRRALVIVKLPGFRTPRIDMHECSAETTTATAEV